VLRFNGATGAFIDVFIPAESKVYGGIAFGPDGNLYVSRPSTHRVLRFNGTTGAFMDVFVSNATSPLAGPAGLIFGANGSLYVCTSDGGAVLRYNSATGAYLQALTPPKASLPRYPRNLALAEMDFPWPYFAE
jgi:sugar lactone lactonase YvrE